MKWIKIAEKSYKLDTEDFFIKAHVKSKLEKTGGEKPWEATVGMPDPDPDVQDGDYADFLNNYYETAQLGMDAADKVILDLFNKFKKIIDAEPVSLNWMDVRFTNKQKEDYIKWQTEWKQREIDEANKRKEYRDQRALEPDSIEAAKRKHELLEKWKLEGRLK